MARGSIRILAITVLVGTIAACSAPGSDLEPEVVSLLISDYSAARVQVLSTIADLDDLARGAPLSLPERGPCGVAVGPGDRLYVADYDGGEILVFDLVSALAGGSPAVLATIGSDDLSGPCGLAFDADGALWVGDYDLDHVVAFRGVAGLTGSQVLEAAARVTLGGDGVVPWSDIIEILIDAAGRLWVVDLSGGTITRIDGVRLLEGELLGREPDAHIISTTATNPPDDGVSTFSNPYSVAVDGGGTLYVGNYGEDYVSRFDGAGSLSGVQTPQPNAYLVVAGIEYPYLVALDAEGALWVGDDENVARVSNPGGGSGVRNLTPTRTVTYSVDGFNDGGGMTFVPMPAGLGF